MKALYFENRIGKIAALRVAERFSRYAALGPFSPLCYAEVPEPSLPNGRWLKVRNRLCGLCGTDIHFMFAEIDPKCFSAATPGVARRFLGHEVVGEVVEMGEDTDGLHLGDRVSMRIDWPSCFQLEMEPPCPQCASGNYMLCQNLGVKPMPEPNPGGGFSPYMLMHRTQPFKIPEDLSDDAALLIEPLACAVHGVLKRLPAAKETVLVLGGGTLGLLSVAALRKLAPGAQVYCLVRYPFQARVAEKLGAQTIREGPGLYARMAERTGARYAKGYFGNEILLGGFDTVYDTVGSDRSLQDALRWTRGGGRVVLAGINWRPGKVDYSPVWAQEVELLGINCHASEQGGETSFDIAARLLREGCLVPGDIITHRFPVAQYKKAVKAFLNKGASGAIKIVLEHGE